jgi:hypothetical protein
VNDSPLADVPRIRAGVTSRAAASVDDDWV